MAQAQQEKILYYVSVSLLFVMSGYLSCACHTIEQDPTTHALLTPALQARSVSPSAASFVAAFLKFIHATLS